MKKIGIVSCYFKDYYGSMLQAYATQKVLDNMGLENETFNIKGNIDFAKGKKKYYKSQIFNYSFIKSKFGMAWLKIYKKLNKDLGKNINIREKKYEEFRKEINLTRPYRTYKELNEYSKNYSSIIVGSDQLWLPVNVVADYYTLNWVPENINKISYATSFGISQVPDKYKNAYINFLNRLNYISVREDKGVEIVKKLINREATLVCDPTMLLTKEEWLQIQEQEPIIKDKYILCYFLGKNIEHRKFAERLKAKTGCKIVSLNHADEYVKYSDKFADDTPYDVGPKEFLNLIRNAEYICTDSFHGTVFSLINNKKFFTFERYSSKNGKISTNSRIYSLLGIMNLQNRVLKGNEDIEKVLNYEIDFNIVNEKLSEFRENSKKYLTQALANSIEIQKENDKIKYIQIDDKSKCCGCTACKSICPQKAIEMKEDEEGFLYPSINMDKCVNCGLCKKVCPVLNKNNNLKEQHAFIFQNKDDLIRRQSTSGGAFSAIAEEIINKNGIVFGAIFDEEFNVVHKGIETKEDLWRFRNSKYVQSDLRNTFLEAKINLDKNRWVCFSGTSCQIEGLKKFLGKDYDKLILVDVVCRAVPSPLIWRKYLKLRKTQIKNIKKIYFRDKIYGYKYSNLSIYDSNDLQKPSYKNGVESDPYLRAFFSNICDRPSCYTCQFKKRNRESDITLWDCFDVEKYNKKFDDDKGTTRILTNSEKGYKFIKKLKQKNKVEEIRVDEATKGFLAMFQSVKYNYNREKFLSDAKTMEDSELFKKYFKDSPKIKLERFLRKNLVRTKIYKKILKLGKIIRKRD